MQRQRQLYEDLTTLAETFHNESSVDNFNALEHVENEYEKSLEHTTASEYEHGEQVKVGDILLASRRLDLCRRQKSLFF